MKKLLLVVFFIELIELIFNIEHIELIDMFFMLVSVIAYVGILIKRRKEKKNFPFLFFIVVLIIMTIIPFVEDKLLLYLRLVCVYSIVSIIFFPSFFTNVIVRKRVSLVIIILFFYVVSFGMFSFHILEEESFIDSLWWSMSTITSVGYGDYVPRTSLGKISGIFVMLGGVLLIALITTYMIEKFKGKIEKVHGEKAKKDTAAMTEIKLLKNEKKNLEKRIKELEDIIAENKK